MSHYRDSDRALEVLARLEGERAQRHAGGRPAPRDWAPCSSRRRRPRVSAPLATGQVPAEALRKARTPRGPRPGRGRPANRVRGGSSKSRPPVLSGAEAGQNPACRPADRQPGILAIVAVTTVPIERAGAVGLERRMTSDHGQRRIGAHVVQLARTLLERGSILP